MVNVQEERNGERLAVRERCKVNCFLASPDPHQTESNPVARPIALAKILPSNGSHTLIYTPPLKIQEGFFFKCHAQNMMLGRMKEAWWTILEQTKKKVLLSQPRSGIQHEWTAGNVVSVLFILPSNSHKLVIDCVTHPINSYNIELWLWALLWSSLYLLCSSPSFLSNVIMCLPQDTTQ